MTTHYDPEMTMKEARAAYFEANGFGQNGGYDEAWVDFKIGPIPFPFPNTPMRVSAVRYHDLHHVLTGYPTTFNGEMLISAWEIGAGCKTYPVAWQLNLGGMAAGAHYMPKQVFRAFVRGRRSRSLYGLPLDELLDSPVRAARERLGVVDADEVKATAGDVALFVLALVAGAVSGLVSFALGLATLPIAYVAFAMKRRREKRRREKKPSATEG